METILNQLAQSGLSLTEAEVQAYLDSQGVDPAKLSKAQALVIAKEIAAQHGGKLTLGGNSKPANTGRGKRKAANPNGLQAMAQTIDTELQAFEGAINGFTEAKVTETTDRIMTNLRNAPIEVVNRVSQECQEVEADPDFFREQARALFAGFGLLGSASATE